MPSITQSLVAFGAGIMASRAVRELTGKGWAQRAQEKHRLALQRALSVTVYGRQCGIEADMKLRAWQERVPLCAYEGVAPFIARMKQGEADVLWPGRCRVYAHSSGTTTGSAKCLPVTDAMAAHFRKAGRDSMLYYAARVGRSDVFLGKHLFLAGHSSAGTALEIPAWLERFLYEPGREIAQMSDWTEKLAAIVQRCLRRDVTMVAGLPSWTLSLAAAVMEESGRRGWPANILKDVWPNLECLVHGGVPVGPFAKELRKVCGEGVNFHEVSPAAEGFIAAQDAGPEEGLRLMADAGIYYEFLPLAEYDGGLLDQLGARAVPLAGVRPGLDYVLIMTTPAGLCRYVIGDVVRFISVEPARLIYSGRTNLQLSAFGERVIEKELTDALMIVCRRNGWQVVNFHVAPLFTSSHIGQTRGSHEWWLELRPGSEATPTGPVLAQELDAELSGINDHYGARRKDGGLQAPVVRLVMPGVFEYWQHGAGCWGGQNKIPRCRGDRKIADELAKIARFHDSE